MERRPLIDPNLIKLWKKLLVKLEDEDEIALMQSSIDEAERDWSDYHDRDTHRQETMWDPANIYDLTHLRDPYDDWEGDDPYESFYR